MTAHDHRMLPARGARTVVTDRFGGTYALHFDGSAWRGQFDAVAPAADALGDSGDDRPRAPMSFSLPPGVVAQMAPAITDDDVPF